MSTSLKVIESKVEVGTFWGFRAVVMSEVTLILLPLLELNVVLNGMSTG